jgi:hypothetical protein
MIKYIYIISSIVMVIVVLYIANINDIQRNKVFDNCFNNYKLNNTITYNDYMINCINK